MNKHEKAALILKEHQEWRMGGDGEPTNPQALTSAIYHAIEALTQAAEIDRGDKVVVPREPTDEMLRKADEIFWSKTTIDYVDLYQAMLAASGVRDE